MKSRIIVLLLSFLVFSSCSTYQYFSKNDSSVNFSGVWQFMKYQDRILTIKKTENDFYSLKFNSPIGKWEAIGYIVDNELLAIFKYTDKNSYGYVTLNLINPNKLSHLSIESNGRFRADGYYTKLKSP